MAEKKKVKKFSPKEREERIRELSKILQERFGYSKEEADDLARIIRGEYGKRTMQKFL